MSQAYILEAFPQADSGVTKHAHFLGPKEIQPDSLDLDCSLLGGFSDPVLKTLSQSREDSTKRIRRVFMIWYAEKNLDWSSPSFPNFEDFLQVGLDKALKSSTLRVQVAA